MFINKAFPFSKFSLFATTRRRRYLPFKIFLPLLTANLCDKISAAESSGLMLQKNRGDKTGPKYCKEESSSLLSSAPVDTKSAATLLDEVIAQYHTKAKKNLTFIEKVFDYGFLCVRMHVSKADNTDHLKKELQLIFPKKSVQSKEKGMGISMLPPPWEKKKMSLFNSAKIGYLLNIFDPKEMYKCNTVCSNYSPKYYKKYQKILGAPLQSHLTMACCRNSVYNGNLTKKEVTNTYDIIQKYNIKEGPQYKVLMLLKPFFGRGSLIKIRRLNNQDLTYFLGSIGDHWQYKELLSKNLRLVLDQNDVYYLFRIIENLAFLSERSFLYDIYESENRKKTMYERSTSEYLRALLGNNTYKSSYYIYEVRMRNVSQSVIYNLLSTILPERKYTIWKGLEALLQRKDLSLPEGTKGDFKKFYKHFVQNTNELNFYHHARVVGLQTFPTWRTRTIKERSYNELRIYDIKAKNLIGFFLNTEDIDTRDLSAVVRGQTKFFQDHGRLLPIMSYTKNNKFLYVDAFKYYEKLPNKKKAAPQTLAYALTEALYVLSPETDGHAKTRYYQGPIEEERKRQNGIEVSQEDPVIQEKNQPCSWHMIIYAGIGFVFFSYWVSYASKQWTF